MLRKFKTFLKMPLHRKSLAVEALLCLIWAEICRRTRSVRWITSSLGTQRPTDHVTSDRSALDQTLAIGKLVETVAQALPRSPLCLTQAMAAKWMLDRRNLPATVYFGAWPATPDAPPKDPIKAHAWISVDTRIIVGGSQSKSCVVIAAFG